MQSGKVGRDMGISLSCLELMEDLGTDACEYAGHVDLCTLQCHMSGAALVEAQCTA